MRSAVFGHIYVRFCGIEAFYLRFCGIKAFLSHSHTRFAVFDYIYVRFCGFWEIFLRFCGFCSFCGLAVFKQFVCGFAVSATPIIPT